MIRFNKQNLLTELENQITTMEKLWGFTSTNGTNQIEDKSDFDRVMAYGQYVEICDICESIRDNSFLN
jgi:hypothetical protein